MTVPLTGDVRHGIRRWGSLGNFIDGDCVIAAFEHARMCKGTAKASSWQKLIWKLGFRPPHTPYSLSVYAKYLETIGQKPGPEVGVAPDAFFTWAKEQGLIIDWGHLTSLTRDSLHQAMLDYNGVVLAIQLTQDAYHNVWDNQAWSIGTDPGSQPDPTLGHATLLVQYNADEDAVVTWGRTKNQTAQFTTVTTWGAYVFLDEQDRNRPNFDQLLAGIASL